MSAEAPSGLAALAPLSTLDDRVRRRLYAYVTERHPHPVSRDDAATAAGIGRTLAAYHLDKLTEAGLLDFTYQRPSGRGGPGAGRPAKLYTRSSTEFTLSVPPRDYELLAQLLVAAVERDDSGEIRDAVGQAAYAAGRASGRHADDVIDALRANGYEPRPGAAGRIELRNCPFHRVAQQHRDVVCQLNLRLVSGLVVGAGGKAATARLDPGPERCCVTVRGDNDG